MGAMPLLVLSVLLTIIISAFMWTLGFSILAEVGSNVGERQFDRVMRTLSGCADTATCPGAMISSAGSPYMYGVVIKSCDSTAGMGGNVRTAITNMGGYWEYRWACIVHSHTVLLGWLPIVTLMAMTGVIAIKGFTSAGVRSDV